MDVATRVGLGRIAPTLPRTRPQNPLMNLYRAADGLWFWLVGAESERHWPGIATAVGAPELIADERFATPRDRRRNGEALVAVFDELLAKRSRVEWAEIFRRDDVWWAPINSVDDLLPDPQVLTSGAFVHVPMASGALPDAVTGVATPIDFGLTPAGPAGAPPAIGADADALLEGLGVTRDEVARLRGTGVIAGG